MQEPDEPTPQVAHYVLLAVAMMIVTAALLLSRRPFPPANQPDIVHLADLSAPIDSNRLGYTYLVPQTRLRPEIARALGAVPSTQPRLGYSIRQVSFLGLPLFAYREAGFALYVETPEWIKMAPIDDETLTGIGQDDLRTKTQNWFFPFWRVGWGWIVPLAVGAFLLLEWRSQLRRRAMMGLI